MQETKEGMKEKLQRIDALDTFINDKYWDKESSAKDIFRKKRAEIVADFEKTYGCKFA